MFSKFSKIGITFNPSLEKTEKIALDFSKKLSNCSVFPINEIQKDIDLAIIIGGDGTFLKCARFYSYHNIPILGFNSGRLGYLTQANPNEIDTVIQKLNQQEYTIENRLMLRHRDKIALNDIVVKGANCSRSATFDLSINDTIVCSYVADGLIVATPTGSTAYSLSAGGPIISPKLSCILIIPICPHTLNTRPIVIPSDEKITIKAHENEQNLNISYDGQVDYLTKEEIVIQKNENFAKLLILNQQKDKFYNILKEKLHWSLSPKK